jgi:hypothetical protein
MSTRERLLATAEELYGGQGIYQRRTLFGHYPHLLFSLKALCQNDIDEGLPSSGASGAPLAQATGP